MQKVSRFQIVLLILITFFVGYYFGVTKISIEWKNYQPQLKAISKDPPPDVTTVDFSQFWTVWQHLSANYYDKSKLDPQKMLNGAITGLVQSVGDPFTIYLPPTQNDNFKQGLAGQFSGIGAELGTKDKDIVVISPLDGSPAQKSGVKAGDVILKVNDESTAGWSLSQAVDKIRGPKDTFVTIKVLHKDDKNPTDIQIKREVITVKSVTGYIKKAKDIENIDKSKFKGDESVVYIRLSQFGDATNKDWLALIDKLNSQRQNDKNFKGVILDLRNNPGGYLTDAVFIASEFLPQGGLVPTKVVLEEGADSERRSLNVKRSGKFLDTPVVVLINKGSASASEIVAGALRDNGRAKLVGETSFGKGTIQQAEDFGNGAGLHVTIAKWLTPNGTWINEKGLDPDVGVPFTSKDKTDVQLEKAIEELLK